MKVYVLVGTWYCEGSENIGVFDSKEKANVQKPIYKKLREYDSMSIEEYEVQ